MYPASASGGNCLAPDYSDPQDFGDDYGSDFDSNGLSEAYDIYNAGRDPLALCFDAGDGGPDDRIHNSVGGLRIAVTRATFAAISVDPPQTSFFQTQEYSFNSDLNALSTASGASESLNWCLQSAPASCSSSSIGVVQGSLVNVGDNAATFVAPNPINTSSPPFGQNFVSPVIEYVCVTEASNPLNYACATASLIELFIYLNPQPLPPSTVSLRPTQSQLFTASVNTAAGFLPATRLTPSAVSWNSWTLNPIFGSGVTGATTTPGSLSQITYNYTAPNQNGSTQLAVSASVNIPAGSTVTLDPASAEISVGSGLSSQTISFGSIPAQMAATTLSLTASASSGLAVSFNSTTPAVCAVNGSVASLFTGGTCTIQAEQTGDATYAAASATQSFTVSKVAPTSVALVSSANPSPIGSAVTFTATLTGAGATPTGTVTFYAGGSPIGTGTLSGGVASFTTSSLTTHTIYASYGGDSTYLTTQSSSFSETITKLTPTVTLVSSANPSPIGSAVTFTATVTGTGATPTGTVTFYAGGSPIGTGTISGGVASYTTSNLTTHTIYAYYGGDSTYLTAQSSSFSETITKLTPTAALVSSANPSPAGSAVTFTVTVTGTGATPTGTVTFYAGGSSIGTGTLGGGVASFTTSSLTTHTVYASYGGDSIYSSTTSNSFLETIQ
jgi:hypothetical protein